MRYFRTSNLELVTMYNVVQKYKEYKTEDLIPEYHNFREWLNACLSSNGGELTPISKEDVRKISVDTVYGQYTERIYRLKETVSNGKSINWDGVNFVIIDEDDNKIFQASGYSEDRGMFCDLY